MRTRRYVPKDQDAPAVVNPTAQMRHSVWVGDVHRRKGRVPAFGFDPIIQLFECAGGLGHGNDVIRWCEGFSEVKAEAARGAGNESDFGGLCHGADVLFLGDWVKRGLSCQIVAVERAAGLVKREEFVERNVFVGSEFGRRSGGAIAEF